MNVADVKLLLNDFNSILLLQFVMSIERFWKVNILNVLAVTLECI
ncbi:hypothetical protein SAMN03159341_12522 [Paenibacillus sp. 1_12]|nr:hypothetical protein SAMN03159341_12522 [Paenibacillus sp. 1_12]